MNKSARKKSEQNTSKILQLIVILVGNYTQNKIVVLKKEERMIKTCRMFVDSFYLFYISTLSYIELYITKLIITNKTNFCQFKQLVLFIHFNSISFFFLSILIQLVNLAYWLPVSLIFQQLINFLISNQFICQFC